MDKIKLNIFSVVVSIIIFIIISGCTGTQSSSNFSYLHNKNFLLESNKHSIYKMKNAEIVMLGNSITSGVNWNELIDNMKIANRGISGDVTEGYLNRMDNVISLKPKLCFIMGGINDLYSDIKPEEVFNNYIKILDTLLSNNIIPVVQSTLFVSPKWRIHKEKNIEVKLLNTLLKNYTTERGIIFLNLNNFLSENDVLMSKYTYDGLHLNGNAYQVWGEEVEKIISDFKL